MKEINLTYTEKEFRCMQKAKRMYNLRVKSSVSWERFLLTMALRDLERSGKYGI